jgi:flavin reductase ActVB
VPVSTQTFRQAMSHHAASVALVTCRDLAGRPAGLTATSVTSLSLSPPRLLVCVGKLSSAHSALAGSRRFLVSLLGAAHAELAAGFAADGELRFALPGLEPLEYGLAGVRDSVARFACRTVDVHDSGDHSIVIGEVDTAVANGGLALVHHRRQYGVIQSAERDPVR